MKVIELAAILAISQMETVNECYLDLEKPIPYGMPYKHLDLIDSPKPWGKPAKMRTEPKIGRNQICPKCDSGLKYKKCCGLKPDSND
jgi:uncharacterized protein YecA (UPF0149 family)